MVMSAPFPLIAECWITTKSLTLIYCQLWDCQRFNIHTGFRSAGRKRSRGGWLFALPFRF
jgi:hypothetical protein